MKTQTALMSSWRAATFKISLIAAVVTAGLPVPVQASNDGNLCDGVLGLAVCGSVVVGLALTPKPPQEKIVSAIQKGELDNLKNLLLRYPELFKLHELQGIAVIAYLDHVPANVSKTEKMKVINYLFDLGVDPSDGATNKLLQNVVGNASVHLDASLEMAKIMFAHGASAREIDMSRVAYAITSEMLQLLLQHGADPNRIDKGRRSTLLTLVRRQEFAMAVLLLEHGADPNAGESQDKPSGLVELASDCDHQAYRKRYTVEAAERLWSECLESRSEMTDFLILHGADVNGKANAQNNCVTPYGVAKSNEHQRMMSTLLSLKADPDFSSKCQKNSL